MKTWTVLLALLAGVVLAGQAMAEPLTAQMCRDKATAAAKLIEAEGEAAFDKIKDPAGEFRFGDGSGYIWVQSVEGKMLMHPIKPEMDGKSLMDIKDINGVYFFAAFSEIANDKGAGWVGYMWPKVGKTEPSPKVSYVVKAVKDGKTYIAGSGIYDVTKDDIKKQFPTDAIYEE
jgi:signal transduction histidine kinase